MQAKTVETARKARLTAETGGKLSRQQLKDETNCTSNKQEL